MSKHIGIDTIEEIKSKWNEEKLARGKYLHTKYIIYILEKEK